MDARLLVFSSISCMFFKPLLVVVSYDLCRMSSNLLLVHVPIILCDLPKGKIESSIVFILCRPLRWLSRISLDEPPSPSTPCKEEQTKRMARARNREYKYRSSPCKIPHTYLDGAFPFTSWGCGLWGPLIARRPCPQGESMACMGFLPHALS